MNWFFSPEASKLHHASFPFEALAVEKTYFPSLPTKRVWVRVCVCVCVWVCVFERLREIERETALMWLFCQSEENDAKRIFFWKENKKLEKIFSKSSKEEFHIDQIKNPWNASKWKRDVSVWVWVRESVCACGWVCVIKWNYWNSLAYSLDWINETNCHKKQD